MRVGLLLALMGHSGPLRKEAATGGVIRDDRGSFVKAFTMNLGCCSITRAEMRGIMEGLKLAWSLVIRKIRVQSDSAADIAILSNGSLLDHQPQFLSCSLMNCANCSGRLLSIIFTAKQIVLRIIWPILVIPFCLVCISLVCLIGVCPIGFTMTLLGCHSLGVLVFLNNI
ncbi:Putative ribonuclease H protein At1g65750 [Linum grandiflorum]